MTSTRTYDDDDVPLEVVHTYYHNHQSQERLIGGASSESLLQYFCPQISFKVVA
jgi:hypothetical protein